MAVDAFHLIFRADRLFLQIIHMWLYAAGLLFIWIRLSSPNKTLAQWIKNGIWIVVPAIIALSTIYIFFLSKGQNPASASPGLKLTLKTFAFPLASPLLSGFSIDDICHGLIYHTGKAIFNDRQAIWKGYMYRHPYKYLLPDVNAIRQCFH